MKPLNLLFILLTISPLFRIDASAVPCSTTRVLRCGVRKRAIIPTTDTLTCNWTSMSTEETPIATTIYPTEPNTTPAMTTETWTSTSTDEETLTDTTYYTPTETYTTTTTEWSMPITETWTSSSTEETLSETRWVQSSIYPTYENGGAPAATTSAMLLTVAFVYVLM